MRTQLCWFAFVVLLALAVASAVRLATVLSGARSGRVPLGRNAVVALTALAGLVVLGLLWRVSALAGTDADVVTVLTHARKPTLESVFNVVTTLGDAIPATVFAAALAGVLHQRTGSHAAWLVPAVVIAEQVLQVTAFNLIDASSVSDLAPGIVTGSGGTFPSGSVPRLFALLMVAAVLWDRHRPATARVLRSAAVVLVLVQGVSRIYLGRHLLADLAGGLALGLLLTAGAHLVVGLLETRWPGLGLDGREPRREATPSPAGSS